MEELTRHVNILYYYSIGICGGVSMFYGALQRESQELCASGQMVHVTRVSLDPQQFAIVFLSLYSSAPVSAPACVTLTNRPARARRAGGIHLHFAQALRPAPYTIATGRLTQRRAYYGASKEHLYSLVLTDRRTQPVRKRKKRREARVSHVDRSGLGMIDGRRQRAGRAWWAHNESDAASGTLRLKSKERLLPRTVTPH